MTLLKAGADVNSKTQDSATALMFASGKGHEAVVKLLLENGADPRIVISGTDDEDGMSALSYAQRYGQFKIKEILEDAVKDS